MTSEKIIAIPVYCAFEALFECYGRFVSDCFFSEGDISKRMLYIAGARRIIYRLNIFAKQVIDYINNFIDSYGLAGGDIYNLANSVLDPRSEQVGFDDIINIGEIPALQAVTINGWRFIFQNSSYKSWYGSCILTCRVLVRTKNVEIPQ